VVSTQIADTTAQQMNKQRETVLLICVITTKLSDPAHGTQ